LSLQDIVDNVVSGYMEKNPTNALVVGIVNDTTQLMLPYGQLSHQQERKPNVNTLFEIGSVTKPFSALLAFELERVGKLKLSEPITTYLPDSLNNPYLKNITIQDLLAHQSGLPKIPINVSATKTNINNPYEHYTNTHLLEFLNVFKPLKSIKKKKNTFRYSDTAYGVLGFILERVGGQAYSQLLNQYILKPLKMKNTYLNIPVFCEDNVATPYSFNQAVSENYTYQSSMEASSGLYTCASDLLTFVSVQLSKNIKVKPIYLSIEKSHQKLGKSNMKSIVMGGGWYKVSQGRRYPPLYISNGGTGGYFTYVAFDKENNTGVVVLSNSTNRVDYIGVELMTILNK